MSLLHYQLIKHIYPSGKGHYSVHEYYNAIEDEADIWRVSPVTLWGEDPDDIQSLIIQVLNDIAEHGIIEEEHDDCGLGYAENTGLKPYETSGDKDEDVKPLLERIKELEDEVKELEEMVCAI